MQRPPSIIWFERFFWGSILIGFLSAGFAWKDMAREIERDAAMMSATTGLVFLGFVLAITVGISIAFWYFIARRGSNVAKWIYVVWTGLGSLWTLVSLFDPAAVRGAALVASLISTLLTLASIACLFRADAVAWLTGKAPVDPGIFS
ncbi:hypothetical protein [Sphingopyxis sp. JAI128]|uniref:hypothetical protein n=1 Tax=Sphingopyxis sp. JAI128 TaxID=2723066 RepID=UPI001617C52E|nr:hypothetical protein [Sphingopyxis sp. JAI128]MBB6424319.1 hypothetical protein [Sphingopyxis sp. JAI128]